MVRGMGIPEAQGLYSPETEKDNCGVGFVCNIKGDKSNDIVKKGIEVLVRLTHRGAVGADPKTGDGAGILLQIPDEFLRRKTKEKEMVLPESGDYGVGMIFLPQIVTEQLFCEGIVEEVIKSEGQEVIGWRDVSTDTSKIGITAAGAAPTIKQVFIRKGKDNDNFELKLYIIRRIIEKKVKESQIKNKDSFYIPSFSSKVIIYKGLLLAEQIDEFYPELKEDDIKSAIALVHQRYSTNTFPSWDLAQPFRFLAHNGEINTIKGNVNWMTSREPELYNDILSKEEIGKVFPITNNYDSDSCNLDHAFELLVASGKSIAEAVMMLVPEPWEKNNLLDDKVRKYYEYNSGLMEPWDGPAAIAFTDGVQIGATLDRNGLRPARYIITKDNICVMASEVGVLDIDPSTIVENGRIQPGKMFLIDTNEGRIVSDEEIKGKIAASKPFAEWIIKNKKNLKELPNGIKRHNNDFNTIVTRMKAFGYTREELKEIITPMAKNEIEPIGSMGNDAPFAVLSNKSKSLFSYFKQLFAQVTNPPIDPIREDIVMSYLTNIGCKPNILKDGEENTKLIGLEYPVISNEDLDKIVQLRNVNFRTRVIPMVFNPNEGLEKGLQTLFQEAEMSIEQGYNILVLSDRKVDDFNAPIPSLLATSALHHYLIEKRKRNGIDIIVETGEAREMMHFVLLIGYGALAVNPYIALESIDYMASENLYLNKGNEEKYRAKYLKAVNKGLVKITSKMGISTIQSYRGAQIFEAVGLAKSLIDKYFTGTPSRIEGIGINVVEKEVMERHNEAFTVLRTDMDSMLLSNMGEYQWIKNGEHHLFNPESITKLQSATKNGNYKEYKEFAGLINNQVKNLTTIRGLFRFKKRTPISIDEVEPIENIMKRFVTGAMSFGSISNEAHEAMAIAMNTIGGKSNSGEGGEDPERFNTNRRSAIKQIASGRFGVTTNYLVNADELQIKMAQGAKPGEGGHLPGHKVSETIAKVRHTTPGIDLISPPPHHDIYSIEDLAQLIFDLKNVNPAARISVKLVSEVGVGTIAAGVAKAHADMILVSGHDGGTGAAPLTSIKHTGLPWELGLAETHQVLRMNNLRGRVRVQTDGQMRTGRDVVIASLLGAEEYGFATVALVVLGCVMMRSCHTNTCPVGVATQDPVLRKKFLGHSEFLINYFKYVAQDAREVMAELGFRTIDEMIGRTDVIEMNDAINHWKADGIDISNILYKPTLPSHVAVRCVESQDHGIDKVFDRQLIELSKPAIENKEKVVLDFPIHNVNRSTGTMLSGEIAKKYGEAGLPDDTITINLKGYAGQSFGTFGMKGITLKLEGQGNDYVGKGLFGAKIIIKAPENVTFKPENNVIAGNTIMYGAIKGEVYINGRAGERFCVRNSGAKAVVEGIGDHGCEYMTGGRVYVLGETGRNFGSGMSGGIAYVYDINGDFEKKINKTNILIEKLENPAETAETKAVIEKHVEYTNSARGKEILADWDNLHKKFVKLISAQYKKILEAGTAQQ